MEADEEASEPQENMDLDDQSEIEEQNFDDQEAEDMDIIARMKARKKKSDD
jgi:hypothetical protein